MKMQSLYSNIHWQGSTYTRDWLISKYIRLSIVKSYSCLKYKFGSRCGVGVNTLNSNIEVNINLILKLWLFFICIQNPRDHCTNWFGLINFFNGKSTTYGLFNAKIWFIYKCLIVTKLSMFHCIFSLNSIFSIVISLHNYQI